ncbi:MAG: hypothetical protein JNJ89_18100 [Rubrivivax sp.]|nr:hypothetical protein [Rubrivivax sp.]
MSSSRFTLAAATAAIAIAGTFAVTAAQARGADVQWSVTIGAPVLTLPVPTPVVVVAPAPRPPAAHWPAVRVAQGVPVHMHGRFREPTRWDVDGDGIPNRHDPLYNPAWDRNGNGVPDMREHRRDPRHGPHGGRDRDRDGIPNRHDRHDDRYDHRHHDGHDHRPWRGEGRGPR